MQTASLTQQAETMAIAADASAKKDAEEPARKAAAETAVAKKKEAAEKAEQEAKEAKERAEAKAAASRSATRDASSFAVQSSYTIAQVQAMARQIVPADQFQCFSNIVDHESSWNYRADNPTSDAYGLVQALPGSKMASAGADWATNPATQIKWGPGLHERPLRQPLRRLELLAGQPLVLEVPGPLRPRPAQPRHSPTPSCGAGLSPCTV
ncbi:hypothetical protein GCM10023238_34530 [Streptomyces heliomycini]